MRIRTDGDYAHRKEAIEQTARFYDQNKTASVVNACEDIPRLARAVEELLARDDFTTEQKREIADLLDLGQSFSVTYSEITTVGRNE
ncbi:DUF7692 domain-containing protein [Halomarina rubra]|uniref:DUF7692 domain-containing protein n=1 Tax=Halomarina rubra TaxID=2071873 RepID=A0ABD6AUI8_9EURY|nr:hypothetical protein [Halomarina rubra]